MNKTTSNKLTISPAILREQLANKSNWKLLHSFLPTANCLLPICIFIAYCIQPTANCFSQTRNEYLQTAADAFKNEDYSTAAYYYLNALEGSFGEENTSYPYEINPVFLPLKKSSKNSSLDTSKNFKSVVTLEEQNAQYGIADQRIVHNLAMSYRLSHDYENAEKWYKKSVQSDSTIYADDLYWYANSLMINGKYDKASEEFDIYIKANTEDSSPLYKSAQRKFKSCNYFAGTIFSVNTLSIVTELDSTINGGTTSFSPSFFGNRDTLVFASARKKSIAEEGQNSLYLSDIFLSMKKDSATFGHSQNLGIPINTPMHEAAGVLSPSGDQFFFTRWTLGTAEKKECGIYVSRYFNNQWLQPMKLDSNVNVKGYKSMNPSLNQQGNMLLFSSDRPGGKGKMDLWYSPINEFGKAGTAVNLGSNVNTEEDEITPFYDYTGKILYYSSDGHVGLGGMDIFKSYAMRTKKGRIAWSKPINLKSPINSSRDDAYFIVYPNQSIGYFASDRKLCADCDGGACYKIYSLPLVPLTITLEGTVSDQKTKKPITNSLITLMDASKKTASIYVITDDEGKYSVFLSEEMSYQLKAQKNKYFSSQSEVSTIGIKKSIVMIRDFYLDKIPSGDIVIPGIEYDFNAAALRPISKLIIDTLSDMLKLNDNLIVEIGAHTDSRGNDVYNYQLSEDRANSVVQYLIYKGIAKERVKPKGYGETQLIITDAEIANMRMEAEKEISHQKNRRTAFKILEEKEIRQK